MMQHVLCLAENLEKNEKIKAELMPTKINEPKTPYHAPLGEENVPDEGVYMWFSSFWGSKSGR